MGLDLNTYFENAVRCSPARAARPAVSPRRGAASPTSSTFRRVRRGLSLLLGASVAEQEALSPDGRAPHLDALERVHRRVVA